MHNPAIDRAWLLNPDNAIQAGAAYIASQAHVTAFDPPKVAAAKNAGGLFSQSSPANQWKMRAFPLGTADLIDRFLQWFNDAVRVLRADQNRPPYSFTACIP
jgi:hypothetical protein